MFVLKRNQVIITALVVMIAVAGYLSWNDNRQQQTGLTVGYQLTDQGDIAALVPDQGILTSIFPDEYPGLANAPWADTHNPAIAVSGDDFTWPALADLDLNAIIAVPPTNQQPNEAGEAIFVSNPGSFFVQARLQREQTRSSERAILNDLINNSNVEAEQRATAAEAMIEIQRRIERETAAEALIESKGFSEVYVRISDNSVDVIVSKETLTEPEIAQIMDIIKRKTGMTETQIHISPMRRS